MVLVFAQSLYFNDSYCVLFGLLWTTIPVQFMAGLSLAQVPSGIVL